jgi:hypothetical protein
VLRRYRRTMPHLRRGGSAAARHGKARPKRWQGAGSGGLTLLAE